MRQEPEREDLRSGESAQPAGSSCQDREALEALLLRLAAAAEGGPRAEAHCRRVGRYAAALARALGTPGEFVESLRVAAMLHDVGVGQLPEDLRTKAGRYTPEEAREARRHTLLGAWLLEGCPGEVGRLARSVALTHHERWDGSGYPRGLAGEAIPLEGRIAALADVFEALTTPRFYKPALPVDQALRILEAGAGRDFDPRMAGIFGALRDELEALAPQEGSP